MCIRDRYQSDTDYYGDPGIQPWIGVPRLVEADFPEILSPGTKLVEVSVVDAEDESAMVGAQVTLYLPGEMPDPDEYHEWEPVFMTTNHTDGEGLARFHIEGELPEGTLYLTITGRDIYPLLDTTEVTSQPVYVAVSGFEIDDTEIGNGDGYVNPGETIALSIAATNYGEEQAAEDVTAVITSESRYLVIEGDEIGFGDISPGDTVDGDSPVTVQVSPETPDQLIPTLLIELNSGNLSWRSSVNLDILSHDLEVYQVVGGAVIADSVSNLDIELENIGRVHCPRMAAELISLNWAVSVIRGATTYPSIQVGEHDRVDGLEFRIALNSTAIPGSKLTMMLVLRNDNGLVDTAGFELQAGEPRENSPQGPDDYGYLCLDDSDGEGWNKAPEYNWVEISRRHEDPDFRGTLVEFDTVYDSRTALVELPFPLRFYGREYDTITIGWHGYIGVGNQSRMINYQNYPMNLAVGGTMGMIAPFWDRLVPRQTTGTYYYYDEETGRFIVEWFEFRHTVQPEYLTFEVILFDTRIFPTCTGDNEILFQYRSIAQYAGEPDWEMPFASVGISSPDGLTGLSYTYRNQYPATSDTLEARRAILFTNTPVHSPSFALQGYVYDAETHKPIEEASVISEWGFSDTTDADGYYAFPDVFYPPYTPVKRGYRGFYTETDTSGDTLQIDFYMLHPVFYLEPGELTDSLTPAHRASRSVTLFNTGNGPLEFAARLEEIDGVGSSHIPHNVAIDKQGSYDGVQDLDWLSCQQQSGTVEAGDSTTIKITINTAGLEEGDYEAQLILEDDWAMRSIVLPVRLNVDENNGKPGDEPHPLIWSLNQNYPNPFNSSTSISYSLKMPAVVRLAVYDLTGREVVGLVDGPQPAGVHRTTFDHSGLPSGVYLYRIEAGPFQAVRKMIVMR